MNEQIFKDDNGKRFEPATVIDKSNSDRFEEDISPPFAKVVTLPLTGEFEGIVIYLGVGPTTDIIHGKKDWENLISIVANRLKL